MYLDKRFSNRTLLLKYNIRQIYMTRQKLSMNEWVIDHFEKSTNPKKKYDAWLIHVHTGKIKKISFGDSSYEHFQDSTPLKLYSHLDHNDPIRRKAYYSRHGKSDPKYWSAKKLSHAFLW